MNHSLQEPTCYQVLGVSEQADASTIKGKFRALMLEHHPDKNPGTNIENNSNNATDAFQSIQQAFDILRDPVRKLQYDQALQVARQRRQGRYESAIILDRDDCVEEQDGDESILVYPCRCGTYLDTSPLEDDEKETNINDEPNDGLLECPGCSLVYDTRKLYTQAA